MPRGYSLWSACKTLVATRFGWVMVVTASITVNTLAAAHPCSAVSRGALHTVCAPSMGAVAAGPAATLRATGIWAAGIWEMSKEHGACFSMITTAAAPWFTRYHHRMPAFLEEDRVEAYLGGDGAEGLPDPWEEELEVMRCENPLRGAKPGPPVEEFELELGLD